MGLTVVQLSKECSANGGVGNYLLNLCSALEADDHKVIVVHADPRSSLLPQGVSDQFYVEGFDQFGTNRNGRACTARVIEILERVKPDIVHIQGNNNFLLEAQIRQRFAAVKSLHVYDFCPSGNKFHHALGKVCDHPTGPLCLPRMVYKRCLLSKRPSVIWWHYRRCIEANQNNTSYLKIIVASEYVKRQAIATGYPLSQIKVLPYFTALPRLQERPRDDEGTILFAGRVVREKGLHRLLWALRRVRTSCRLIVAGDGLDLSRVKRLTQRLGLSGRIEFAGWADGERLSWLYREASLVVIPSVWPEPFGIVGIEAMSFAKPVVAFNVGGIPEWLENGNTGFLIPLYDVNEMAEKISYLLERQDIAREVGMRGRTKVEREFNKEKHITKLLEIYREVMDGRSRASTPAH